MIAIPAQPDHTLPQLLGNRLAQARKQNRLSQKQLSQGICSQSMISSLEQGNYVPNVILLSKLCQRLHLSMDHLVLKDYPTIDHLAGFNQKIKQLCNDHRYPQMLDYLSQTSITDTIYRDEDNQTYYYYYGIAAYQVTQNARTGLRYLNLALNETFTRHQSMITPNELLILTAIAFLTCRSHQTEAGLSEFETHLNRVRQQRVTKTSENTNILFYQYGLSCYEAGQYQLAANVIAEGIKWTTDHDSHYMLADLFFLLAKVHQALKRPNDDLLLKSQTLAEIFVVETYPI
ncbi:helix-turn-helix transcriptional regulator [Lactiplantibacillus sp. WILCCON 0030]|uniref:Helix-turn-helix transcriptional regulator n=2 Tax=Lactiplantibacillus brownii TaxID=3069269 RepID=A0ABU1A8R2_9LACO|nr:helix-turn-helix transcriptional regulator [Lactiplantibacillus brownii]MDQ7937302.1 helix-turn-helix transcriptional regulator [Lactiplantibacillus brownii]